MQFRFAGWRSVGYGLSVIALTAIFVACGSGSGEGPPTPPVVIDVGVQSATIPSTVVRSILNPLSEVATVTPEPSTGPLAFEPASFPRQVSANASFSLPIVFTPVGPGVQTSMQTLVFETASGIERRTFELKGTGESLQWQVNPEPADFGFVLPGDEALLTIEITNSSANSPVTFSSGTPPLTGVEILGSPFPLTLPPGVPVQVDLRFAPPEKRDYSGPLRLGEVGDAGGPLFVPLIARGTGAGEQVFDFGQQVLSNGLTPMLEVEVPDDAVSLTVEAIGGPADMLGLGHLEGPNGQIYENNAETGPHPWLESQGSFATHLPSGDTSVRRLAQGGGTYKFQMRRLTGTTPALTVRAIVERRPSGTESQAILPLNVFWALGVSQTAASAPTDATWQAVLSGIRSILLARGVTIGDIAHYDINDSSLDNPLQADLPRLFTQSRNASATRLNIFFVRSVDNGQLVGLAGGIGGPKRNGQSSSGVVVGMDGLGPGALAQGTAHEMCHYLGLWHTVEATGVYDFLNDTPQCPVVGTSGICTTEGGGLLMHWQALGGTAMSVTQGQIIRRHSLMEPSPADLIAKPVIHPDPPMLSEEAIRQLRGLPHEWCGTCRARFKSGTR